MLTIERMYELADRAARSVPPHPVCDRDDLIQCAVIGMMEARVPNDALASVVARRRIIDEVRRHRGRPRGDHRSGRAALHEATHLYRTLPGVAGARLADVIPADDDTFNRIESRVDAVREAPMLLRAIGRVGKHVLLWHVVQERSMAEIALRYGVTESRISQIASAALARARDVHAARGRALVVEGPRRRVRQQGRDWLEATAAEKRAFGEFRRLQRAGLRRQEALASMPEPQRLLAIEYQRKCQRRVRARAAGELVAKLPPRSQRRYESVEAIVITPEERSAAGAVWTHISHGMRWRDAVRLLPPTKRALAESYNTKMRARSRVRARTAAD
jgi:RNA polymerase sigma factor (sigma-70 family)